MIARMTRNTLGEARTKIVATVGPACEDEKILTELVQNGVDVFRINAAHGKQADFARILEKIKSVRKNTGFPVAVLLDLAGPKIRLGQLVQDPLEVEIGQELSFIRGENATKADELTSNYGKLIDEVKVGDRVMLADGTITLEVIDKSKDTLKCVVVVRSAQKVPRR
jgi:pyruvate kinase